VSAANLFPSPPQVEFPPPITHCLVCGGELKVQKTRFRTVNTLHVGRFRAREVVRVCKPCGRTYGSEKLCSLVPPGANFGYDVMVYAGKALFLRYRNEEEVVAELARRNVLISRREVSLLGMKFIVYLALAHQQRAPDIIAHMQTKGGYVCHLDATCEGRDPLLMSSIDSLSEIVLGNVKLPAEDEEHIVAFLQRIKDTFGIPVALVHDMGRGILKAVDVVFPGVADFICHFHFLRDIGKDFMATQYDIIRNRLCHHQINAKLRYRAKQLKERMDQDAGTLDAFAMGIESKLPLPPSSLESLPFLNCYTLIGWTLQGKSEGDGYGFPFDHPHLAFAKRIRRLQEDLERIKDIHLRGEWKDNKPYFKTHRDLKKIIKDKTLWNAVEQLEKKITVFERLRKAMRIAPQSGSRGLNDEGQKCNIGTIEGRVKEFRAWLTTRENYHQDQQARKMIEQINKYWEKLFADPITVQTPTGTFQVQPQRTNNILEQFFRSLKRTHRRKTGNRSASPMLRTMLAETPLVRNLQNPTYMKVLLNGKETLEDVFAEIEIDTLRKQFHEAQLNPERIPAKIKPLIAMLDYPEKLVSMIERTVPQSKSNRILPQ